MVQVFNVLTEFRFEVGSAVLGTQKLQSAVEGVSQAADNTLMSFQRLGVGVAASLGLGEGGLLGILYTGIKSFDKFRQSQLAFANVLGNGTVPFEDRMLASAEIMEKMNKLASEFALPVDDLISFTKVLGPMLNNKGLAGPQFSTAIDISRNLLKSAPTLGVDPGLVQGQLLRMIEGQASTGDTLFNRLGADTKTMKPFLGNSKAFNALDEAKRVGIIGKALKEFASDAKVLEANVNTLRGQFQIFQNTITGTVGILRPIGEALMVPIIKIFKGVNAYLLNQGAAVVKSLARGFGPLIESPERLIASLMQLKRLNSDVKSAGTIVTYVGAIMGLNHVLHLLGLKIPVVSFALGGLTKFFALFEASIFTLGATWGGFLNSFIVLISRIAGPLILLVGLFQLISRAIAIARINDAKKLMELAPRIAEIGARFMRIFDVFVEGFDAMAQLIAPLFEVAGWAELLIGLLDSLSIGLALVLGGFQGIAFAILEFVSQIQSLFSGGGFSFSAIGDAFGAGVDQMIERILGKVDNNEGSIANMTTNIAKVEIRNDFKEQQEPDRIAFTLKDQLLKAAQNPTQRRGTSFQTSTVGN